MLREITPLPLTDLKEFRAKVQFYCRQAQKTQQDLAAALGLAYPSLNKKLTGQRRLTTEDVRQIILALAGWQSFETFEQISEVLRLAGYEQAGSLEALFSSEERQRLLIEAPSPGFTNSLSLTVPHNLPQLTSSFIGRQGELAQLEDYLTRSRWVTLVGTGGCGKTRLALEAIRQLLNRYQGGVWWVELGSLSVGELVQETVAAVLNVREQTGQSLLESLIKTLKRGGPTLLVLDNCEHLLAAAQSLIGELLDNCPELVVLMTSREKSGAAAELVLEVGPLGVPPVATPKIAGIKTGTPPLKLIELRQFDSVRLFEERARQSLVSFKLERANAQAVQDICAGLDGIPLALELAASRLEALSVHQLHSRLNERFRLLSRDKHLDPATARQQTLRDTIDWSYALLTPAEQSLFARLSVFAGGFTLPAAQALCNPESDLEIELGERVQSLLHKNLLRQWLGLDGEQRYGMLQTIRQYAQEKLSNDIQAPILIELYATYYLKLIEELQPNLKKSDTQGHTKQIFESEYENIQETLYQSIHTQNLEVIQVGIELAWRLWDFWNLRGNMSEAQHWLDSALEKAQSNSFGKTTHFAELLSKRTALAFTQAQFNKASSFAEQALAIYRTVNDHHRIAATISNLATINVHRGEWDLAEAFFEQCLAVYQELANIEGLANTYNNMAGLSHFRGDYRQSLQLLEQSLKFIRQLDNPAKFVVTLSNLAEVSQHLGEYDKAEAYLLEAQATNEKLDYQLGQALSLNALAGLATARAAYSNALHYAEKSIEINRELGNLRGIIESLIIIGFVETASCRYDKAFSSYKQIVEINRQLGNLELFQYRILEGFAWLTAQRFCDSPNLIKGVQMFAAAQGLREKFSITNSLSSVKEKANAQTLAQLREQLGAEEFEQAWQRGLQMEAGAAIELGLNTHSG